MKRLRGGTARCGIVDGIAGKIVASGLKYIDEADYEASRTNLGVWMLFRAGSIPLSIFTLLGLRVEKFLELPVRSTWFPN